MSFEIKYTDKYSGKETVHKYSGSEGGAKAWAETLARENNCKAVCESIANGPYDFSGQRTHVISVGDKK